MNSVIDIFDALGGPSQVARLLHVRQSTASEMKRRGSIPAEYWAELVRAARERGIRNLDSERLVMIHSRIPPRSDEEQLPEAQPSIGLSEDSPPYEVSERHFGRFKRLRRTHFASAEEIVDHVRALRDEWDRR
jgi:hypothetical protein